MGIGTSLEQERRNARKKQKKKAKRQHQRDKRHNQQSPGNRTNGKFYMDIHSFKTY